MLFLSPFLHVLMFPVIFYVHSFIHSFILNIYVAPLQETYSEALPTPARLNKSCVIGFLSLFYDRSISTHSLDPLFLIVGEFQAWNRNLDPNFCPGRGLSLGPLA